MQRQGPASPATLLKQHRTTGIKQDCISQVTREGGKHEHAEDENTLLKVDINGLLLLLVAAASSAVRTRFSQLL